jgi:uncharacterized protein
MTTGENKELMQRLCAALSAGDSAPFREAMADGFTWTVMGDTAWSGTYRGKPAVLRDLIAPLFAQFADAYTNVAHNFVAEGDQVVVECRGRVATKSGARYDNAYCWVCRLEDGKLVSLTEYLDTRLLTTALAPPARG